MRRETDLLIVGAGPFGLALAAYAAHLGVEYTIVGEPMGFWRRHMPAGMYLRSDSDWHLDVTGNATIDAYTASLGRARADVEPLSLDYYLAYARWFQEQKGIQSDARPIDGLEKRRERFIASFDDQSEIAARHVVLALGFRHFASVPGETAVMLPAGSWGHTCDVVDLAQFAGQRVLIIGGRQSAFEWAALLLEHGAASIDVSYRHDTPAFAPADWSWVLPIVDAMAEDPGWLRRLSAEDKGELNRRLWAEGRLKLEPWLAKRIHSERVHLWPRTRIERYDASYDGLRVYFDRGSAATVDRVIFATGYKVDLQRVPMLESLLPAISCSDGSPMLNERFESSIPGLYMTSMAATRDFGPFFAFTVAARTSARVIGDDVARSLAG